MCDRREQIPRERDGSWPLCPAAGGRGCATAGSKSPGRETVRGRFARRRRQGMCDRREQIPRERDGSWPLCPAAGIKGNATICKVCGVSD